METKNFHLGDILSITTSRFLSPRAWTGIYDILNFMTRDRLYSHQLIRARDECAPYLLRQHPELKGIRIPDSGTDGSKWLAEQVAKYGEYLPVEQVPMDDHTEREPLEELEEMIGPNRIIYVDMESPQD